MLVAALLVEVATEAAVAADTVEEATAAVKEVCIEYQGSCCTR